MDEKNKEKKVSVSMRFPESVDLLLTKVSEATGSTKTEIAIKCVNHSIAIVANEMAAKRMAAITEFSEEKHGAFRPVNQPPPNSSQGKTRPKKRGTEVL